MNRRFFIRLLSLFSGTTLLSSCGSDREQKDFISYLVPLDEGVIPGKPLWYAATCTECPAGCGVRVRVREGWPVKLEGTIGHPVNDGALCVRGQASLWRLYHPQRFKSPQLRDTGGQFQAVSWEEALERIDTALGGSGAEGRRSVYLAGRTTGSLDGFIARFCESLGVERAPAFEWLDHGIARQANKALFDRADLPSARLDRADFLLTLGADLVETFVSPVAHSRGLAVFRENPEAHWIHLEPHRSLTGASADRRWTVRPGSEVFILAFLLHRLAGSDRIRQRLPETILRRLPEMSPASAAERSGLSVEQLTEAAFLLEKAKQPLLLVGGPTVGSPEGLDAALLAGLIQWTGGMFDGTLDFAAAENYLGVGTPADLLQLGDRLSRDEIGVLFLARTNPVYHLPRETGFAENLGKARLRVALADLPDETTAACDLILPLSHGLEAWGDAVPRRGVRALQRPAVKPLYDTLSEGDILLRILRKAGKGADENYRELLFAEWRRMFDTDALAGFAQNGFIREKIEAPPLKFNADVAAARLAKLELNPPRVEGPVLIVTPSVRRFDGRSRPLALLSEIPDPMTTISYGEWLAIGPEEAKNQGLADRDRVRIAVDGWSAELAVKVQPGLPDGVIMAPREALDRPPFLVDGQTGQWTSLRGGVGLTRLGGGAPLSILSGSPSQNGRGLIPDPVHRKEGEKFERYSLYPEHEHKPYRWTMAIDLEKCIGCGACAAACYVENSVPVVGSKEHLRGREMSWLRIEPFYDANGEVAFLPMLCQQCHYAPCEPVCPVYAAYHNPEGLNVQVYNRCVGTRYCSNNCPYKVRRFNWWAYKQPKPLDRMRNPDITHRGRGVMEKCTFCIQRIRAAKNLAKEEGRSLRDGDVVPACAQTCPTHAIVFGNLLDEQSEVYRLSNSERTYRVFEELGTESSVYYLHRVRSDKKIG